MFKLNLNKYMFLSMIYLIFLIKIILNFKFIFSKFEFISVFMCIFILVCLIYFISFLYFYKESFKPMILNMISIYMSMMIMFSKNIINFFIFFEISILPIFFYMIYYGITEKKMISSFYLLIYTSIFSMLFLTFLVLEINNNKSNNMFIYFFLFHSDFNYYKMVMMLIFFVKIPMFIFHIWLPKAHVESSCFGSMILAGILLKLGCLGMMIFMNINLCYNLMMMIMIMLFISSIYILIICFMLNDLKMIIAYFSVSHMIFFIISYILMNFFSLNFCFIMMISHSISSSLLFFFCMIVYNNYSSRNMMKISSMFNYSNCYSWIMYLFMMMNISLPPTLNFMTEMLVFYILMKFSFKLFFLTVFFISISGLISIFMILKTMMFKEMMVSFYLKVIKMNNIMMFLIYVIYSLILMLKLDLFN